MTKEQQIAQANELCKELMNNRKVREYFDRKSKEWMATGEWENDPKEIEYLAKEVTGKNRYHGKRPKDISLDWAKTAMKVYQRVSNSHAVMMDSTGTALPLNMFHEGMMYAIEHIDEVKRIAKAEEKEKRILSAINKLEIGWNSNWGANEVAKEASVTLEEAEDAFKRYEI